MNGAQINEELRGIREMIDNSGFSPELKLAQEARLKKALRNQVAEEVVELLSDYANQSFATPEDFVAMFIREHRTIQQKMFGLLLAVVEEYGKPGFGEFDLRNLDSVKIATQIRAAIGTPKLPFI